MKNWFALAAFASIYSLASLASAQCIPATDPDGDGVLNAADLDDDNDGIIDTVEMGEFDPSEVSACDTLAETDADGDGHIDAFVWAVLLTMAMLAYRGRRW